MTTKSPWYRAEDGELRAYPSTQGSLLYVRRTDAVKGTWEWGTRFDGNYKPVGYEATQARAKAVAMASVKRNTNDLLRRMDETGI